MRRDVAATSILSPTVIEVPHFCLGFCWVFFVATTTGAGDVLRDETAFRCAIGALTMEALLPFAFLFDFLAPESFLSGLSERPDDTPVGEAWVLAIDRSVSSSMACAAEDTVSSSGTGSPFLEANCLSLLSSKRQRRRGEEAMISAGRVSFFRGNVPWSRRS